MIYQSSYMYISLSVTVLNVVVHAFNCKYKSRYHSFYLLYDTVQDQSFHVHILFTVLGVHLWL